MKLGIFSHCTIDEITIDGDLYERPGGPACYCALAARNLGFEVDLVTKFGPDFTFSDQLQKNKIKFQNVPSIKPTTRFTLEINGAERTLWLQKICDEIEYQSINADGILVSPVFNEITKATFERIKNDSNMIFLDPQGFLRRVDSNNKVFFERTDLDLTKVSVIKADPNEVFHLTGEQGINGVQALRKKGIEHILYTNKRDVSLFYKTRQYSLTLPNVDIYDTVGVGDIFTSTFCCTLLKERDVLWALSFAGGAAQAALESKKVGLDKTPPKGATQTNASYFYNTLKFVDI
ncbi:MAG TPA: PfkB family carbohydrate kinase [Candidatus Nitrosotenuis sp.]|nr:PfkB family carbohydrate kinase [Candidatus Nitrosotenuis sp.]